MYCTVLYIYYFTPGNAWSGMSNCKKQGEQSKGPENNPGPKKNNRD